LTPSPVGADERRTMLTIAINTTDPVATRNDFDLVVMC
jgi:hypothetical protein